MKYSEEAIEKVMTGLRHSEAPQGIEHRILAALDAHASNNSASDRRNSRLRALQAFIQSIARQPLPTVAIFACAIVVIIVLSVAVTVAHRNVQAPAQSKLSTSPAVTQDAYVAPIHREVQVGSSRARPSTQKPRLVSATYSLSLHELHTANHPAPELPLTQEEMLLLRVAHSGNPKELAMLNSQVRAKKEAEEEAEFQKFVEPPTGRDLE